MQPVTVKQLATALGITERAVYKRAKAETWPKLNGQGKAVFQTAMLPADIRERLDVVKAEETGLIKAPKPKALPVAKADYPEDVKRQALMKTQLVQAFDNARATAGWGRKVQAAETFCLSYNAGVLMPQIFKAIGPVKISTLRAYSEKLKKSGGDYTVLCDGRGGLKKYGHTRWRECKLSAPAQAALLKCYLRPNQPSMVDAIRAARMGLEMAGYTETSSDSTFRRFYADWAKYNAHVVILARESEKALIDQAIPFMTRDASKLKVGDVLVPDGKILNFQILHPDTGKPVRMILIVFLDWASRYPVGWQIMPTESSQAIQAAFYNAVVTLGMIPKAVYMDNGKAFKAKIFTHIDPDLDELSGLYYRIGTAWQCAKPYSGRTKPVERFFLTLQSQLEPHLPSYVGNGALQKPARMLRNEKFHQQMHEALTQGWVPTIREANIIIEDYINWHVRQQHEGLKYECPADVLEAGKGPGVDMKQLHFDFLWRFKTHARRCRIRRWGIDYEADFLLGRTDEIVCMYDITDLNRIHCYDQRGIFIGEAYPVEAVHPVAQLFGENADAERIKWENKRQARLKKTAKDALRQLGAGHEEIKSLEVLPGNRKVAVIANESGRPAQVIDVTPKPIDSKTETRLQLVYEQAKEENDEIKRIAADTPDRPTFFSSQLERYEWCFRSRHKEGFTLSREDDGFMADFEESEEYLKFYRGRFEDLLAVWGVARLNVEC